MRLRIISDLHLDFNHNYKAEIKDKEVFTIICGDTSAYFQKTSKWLRKNIKQGVFIAGNHIFYNESKYSLQYYLNQLAKHYPLENELSFLENSHKVLDDIIFVGGILWTDYALYGEASKQGAKTIAELKMNDFRYGKVRLAENLKDTRNTKRLRSNDCEEMFNETIKYIEDICKQYPEKKIVVVTHHAPSLLSIPFIYKESTLSASYASNLDDFIMNNPNIKLWCHGHIHEPSDYIIGNCRVVCNPRGYVKYKENPKFDTEFIVEV
ncbi:MAG: metallophosphoesterase [Alphaproteobacteria bacterium]